MTDRDCQIWVHGEPITFAYEYYIGGLPKLRPALLHLFRVIGTVTALDADRAETAVFSAAVAADGVAPVALRLVPIG